ncbi:MAG: acetate--CoA ligase family protein, partial [Deltaproteobacteria bacterium]|nr:acetate--CoA ligase family protein [Deltaproteobacteria bacterium]
DGVRGRPGADKEALAEAVLRLARLLEENPRIKEIDLNPVKALPPGQGLVAVDARVVVG